MAGKRPVSADAQDDAMVNPTTASSDPTPRGMRRSMTNGAMNARKQHVHRAAGSSEYDLVNTGAATATSNPPSAPPAAIIR